jgi:hypothetical protein
MQRFAALALIAVTGCASTVHRLDGEYPTPSGRAGTACEKQDWLVVAPTRADIVEEGHKSPTIRDDGAALYKVGEDFPESITGMEDELGRHAPETFARHADAVSSYDTKRIVAGSLGAAGIIAIGVGTGIFIGGFGEEQRNADGMVINDSTDDSQIITGAVTVGIGLALGIAGIAINPRYPERSRGDAARYVFLPPEDSRDLAVDLAEKHNQAVRERCEVGTTDR